MSEILLFTLIAVTGVLVQSFVGFAGSLLAVPLFALFLTPRQAIPTYNLVLLVIDVLLVLETRQHLQWHRVAKLLAGGLVGIPIGAYGLNHLPLHVIGLIISTVTGTFAVLFLLKIRINLRETTRTQLCVGFLSGLLGGSVSESGPPVVIYGLARNWDKHSFRTTLLTYFLFLCIMANVCYGGMGMFSARSLVSFSVAIGPAILASFCGIRFKNRVSEAFFRRAVLVVIIGVSVVGIVRSVWSA